MHSVHAPGYSDFFTSGIRLVSRRFAVEGHVRSTSLPVPIPLSFDSGSDSESETEMTKRRSWRTSRLVSNSKLHGDRDLTNDGKLVDRKKRRRCSSLMSITHHLFRSRRHRIPNDESGWLSSASSTSSFEDSIDLVNSAVWPECPNGGLVYRTEPQRDLEPFDPFSSSPDSKSFFFDPESQTSRPAIDSATSARNNNNHSSSPRPRPNRFSLSSISSASTSSLFSSTTKRNSTLSGGPFSQSTSSPPPDASFLHFPRSSSKATTTRTPVQVVNKRPASMHIVPSSTAHSHARRPQSLPQSHSQTRRSRVVRSLFLLSKSAASISTSIIPEGGGDDQTEIDNDSDVDTHKAPNSDLSSDARETEEEHEEDGDEDSARSRLMIVNVQEEEEARVSAPDAQQFFFENTLEEDDVSKSVDWREFCLEILDGQQ